jgi:hypothetical protein
MGISYRISTRFAQVVVHAAGNSIRQIEEAIRAEGINPSKVLLIESIPSI